MPEKHVDIYTDGACSGNPGDGGWAAILFYRNFKREISGGERDTTNNRMELKAVIKGLKMLKEPCDVTVYSDSRYCVDAFLQGWVYGWQRNGWRTASKEDVKNVDLWKELLSAMKPHKVTFVKVKGHADNEHNNRCDALARAAIAALPPAVPKAEGAE